jgi:hypothetical protein
VALSPRRSTPGAIVVHSRTARHASSPGGNLVLVAVVIEHLLVRIGVEPVARLIAAGILELVIEPVARLVAAGILEPVIEPTARLIAVRIAEPVVRAAAGVVDEPVVRAAAGVVDEPVARAIAGRVPEPVTIPIVTPRLTFTLTLARKASRLSFLAGPLARLSHVRPPHLER